MNDFEINKMRELMKDFTVVRLLLKDFNNSTYLMH